MGYLTSIQTLPQNCVKKSKKNTEYKMQVAGKPFCYRHCTVLSVTRNVTLSLCTHMNLSSWQLNNSSAVEGGGAGVSWEHWIERQWRKPLGGSVGMPPLTTKFWNLEVRECYFQSSPRDICNFTYFANYFIHCLSKAMHIEKYNACNVSYK